jgi:regulator of replication initiation timing
MNNMEQNYFKRIQNENTILNIECNRLRTNLNETFMHVVDVEQRLNI